MSSVESNPPQSSSNRCGKTDDQRTMNIEPFDEISHEVILKIKDDFESLCFVKVHNSNKQSSCGSSPPDRSSINLEPSFDLSFDEIFSLPDLVTTNDFPVQLFEEFLQSNPDMTFKELSNIPMEQNDQNFNEMNYSSGVSSSVVTNASTPSHDESTNSSMDSSPEETERDTINRRGLKKSGGPVRKLARFGNKQVIKYSDEYVDRRVKNNEAVKKSRMKAKEKQKDTEHKMSKLAEENRSLNDRVDMLLKELTVLKSLYRELNQDLPSSAVKALERVNVR